MNQTIKISALITKLILFNFTIYIYAQSPCGNEAGSMPGGFFPACYGEFVSSTALDTNIAQENSALIYILHLSDSTNTVGIVFDYNSTGVFYNDGTYPTNIQLYIASYVGPINADGSPILSDECADVTLPGTPVGFYDPIIINHDVTCNINGCLTVDFNVSGGSPDFPGNTSNYIVQGDYNGIIEESNEMVSFTRCDSINDYSYNYAIQVFSDDGSNCNTSIQSGVFYCHVLPGYISPVYPGDLNHDGIVNNQDIGLSGLYKFEIGAPRTPEDQNTEWYAHPAEDWNRQHLNNEDIKHFDCNGDGAITDDDRQAVEDNIGEMWSIPEPVDPPDASDYQIVLHPVEEINDNFLRINVALENAAGNELVLQGGHFTIDYGMDNQTIINATMSFLPFSWLGARNLNLIENIQKQPNYRSWFYPNRWNGCHRQRRNWRADFAIR